jgi:hypothetical protein
MSLCGMGLLDGGLVRFDPRIIAPRKTANGPNSSPDQGVLSVGD